VERPIHDSVAGLVGGKFVPPKLRVLHRFRAVPRAPVPDLPASGGSSGRRKRRASVLEKQNPAGPETSSSTCPLPLASGAKHPAASPRCRAPGRPRSAAVRCPGGRANGWLRFMRFKRPG
jgi:hypothetical protein